MRELDEKLQQCFALVFPALGRQEIEKASVATVDRWDSVATITLIAVIEEQLGVTLDSEDFLELTSYQLVLQHLGGIVGARE